MTSKAEKCRLFREDVLHPLQDAVESMGSYYGMPGAKENKYLRNAGTQVECALYNLTRALNIFESREEKEMDNKLNLIMNLMDSTKADAIALFEVSDSNEADLAAAITYLNAAVTHLGLAVERLTKEGYDADGNEEAHDDRMPPF